jgi:FAD:protein FMN transferase
MSDVGIRRTIDVMGMPVTIAVRQKNADTRMLDAAFDEFRLLDRIFSPYRPDSTISQINRGELDIAAAGAEVAHAIEMAGLYERATEGYFSAWLNGRLDLCGLVKGWAIDRACSKLESSGAESYFVDAGGDVRARGGNGSGDPWRIGIRHPVQHDLVVGVVTGLDLAVATSGTYEKGLHVLNPRTRLAADELVSVTVVGADILDADVYATAVLAMGTSGLDFIERVPGYEAYVIGSDLLAGRTSGFDLTRTSPERTWPLCEVGGSEQPALCNTLG